MRKTNKINLKKVFEILDLYTIHIIIKFSRDMQAFLREPNWE